MNKISFLFALITLIIYSSCVDDKTPVKTYSIDTKTFKIGWTGFKYTEKVGVSEYFDVASLTLVENSVINQAEQYKLLQNASIKVTAEYTSGVLNLRDANLMESFFGVLETKVITGKVISVDPSTSTGVLSLNFNNVEAKVTFKYSIIDNEFKVNSRINLKDFNAMAALNALAEKCKGFHTGSDGLSITWPDVAIYASAKIITN